jgi:predicted RNase H-like HicB family nuclease
VTVAGKPGHDVPKGTRKYPETSAVEGEAVSEYLVVIEKAEKNYSAYSPDLPCCAVTADTKDEALKLMLCKENIDLVLDRSARLGQERSMSGRSSGTRTLG